MTGKDRAHRVLKCPLFFAFRPSPVHQELVVGQRRPEKNACWTIGPGIRRSRDNGCPGRLQRIAIQRLTGFSERSMPSAKRCLPIAQLSQRRS